MALNDPREIPYEFRVVAFDDWAWLYDNSERTFICDTWPKIYMEALYALEEGEHELYPPEPNYFHAHSIEALESFPLELESEEVRADVERQEAWDTAREEANANHVL